MGKTIMLRRYPILTSILLLALTGACKREQAPEAAPAEAAEEPTQEEPRAAADDEPEAANPADSAPAAQAEPGLPVPSGWTRVSAETPKGNVVSFGVPEGWVEMKPPNEDTLILWGAPVGQPGGTEGSKASLVAVDFEGNLAELADHTRLRLASFAEILSEGPYRIRKIKAHKTAARWSTPVGESDTIQVLVATGDEAIGVTCQLMPGKIEALSPMCDEIFATLSISGSPSQEGAKR
jgi:hypothetical protein